MLDTGPQVIKLVANATQIPAAQWIPACAGMTIKKEKQWKNCHPVAGPRTTRFSFFVILGLDPRIQVIKLLCASTDNILSSQGSIATVAIQ